MSSAPPAHAARKERLTLMTLVAVQFTHVMDFMIIMPLGSHLMRVFDIEPAQFSRLVAAYGIAAAVSGFVAGFVLDRFDRKHALLALYSGFGLATLACALAPGYSALLMARLAAGAFGGIASALVVSMVGDLIPPARRGRAMGIVAVSFPIASVFGVPTGLILADKFEWHAPFFFLAALSLIAVILICQVLPSLPAQHAAARPWQQMKAILGERVHQRAFLVSGALVFAGAIIVPFFAPSMVANVGLTEAQLPLIYLTGGLCTFVSTPWIGRLADRYDKIYVIAWVTLAASILVLVLTNLPRAPVPVALLVSALFMIAMSSRFGPVMAMVTNAVGPRYRGGFMSVNSAVQQASSGVASLSAGLLVSTDSSGRLVGYPNVGLVALVFFGLTLWFAARLRALAPHASKPGQPEPLAAAAID